MMASLRAIGVARLAASFSSQLHGFILELRQQRQQAYKRRARIRYTSTFIARNSVNRSYINNNQYAADAEPSRGVRTRGR